MKRILSALVAFALLLSFAPFVPIAAQAATSGRYTYTVTDGKATITDYYIYGSGELVIPSDLDGYPVTAIGDGAFEKCEYLTGITVPEGVTSIGDRAFYYCSKLKTVTLPESVTSIGSYAFSHCFRLTGITLPEKLTHIGDYMFDYCYDLKSLVVPKGVTSIGNHAFSSSGLSDITLYDGLTYIGDSAFSYSGITTITLPKSVTSIGSFAFDSCWLTSITLPAGLTDIKPSTFYRCQALVDVQIPGTVSVIGKNAFWDCNKLATITIPEGVTSIGDYAFSHCDVLANVSLPASLTDFGLGVFDSCPKLSNLQISEHNERYATDGKGVLFNKDKTELIGMLNRGMSGTYVIPEGVTRIGEKAFSGCTALTGISIPASVTDIADGAFLGCTGLAGFTVDAGNEAFSTDGKGVLFNKDKIQLLYAPIAKMTAAYTIPAGVTEIGDYAFYSCSKLTGITIPAGVTKIGNDAFSGCSKLTSVTIPSGVTEIGNWAFANCSSLTGITIPEGVTYLGHYAFDFCTALTNVKLPGSLTDIRAGTFEGCYSLTAITIPSGVISIGDYAFQRCGLTTVTIPHGVTSIGKSAFQMSALTSISLPDSLTFLGESAFCETNLSQITIPGSITEISSGLFGSCTDLTDVAIPNSVTKIGSGAFSGCEALTGITIPASVTEIGNSAFAMCYALTDVVIPEGVTAMGNKVFYYCESLSGVSIPNSIITIGSGVFEGCDQLLYYADGGSKYLGNSTNRYLVLLKAADASCYQIMDNTKIILEQAFLNCRSLTQIEIPSHVTSIAAGAFNGCTALASIQVSKDNGYYCTSAGALFNKDKTVLLRMPAMGISGNYTLADSVSAIGAHAFSECAGLTSIELPTNLTSVDSNAFEGCDNLAYVWYRGSEEDRANITVAAGNGYFEKTAWYYNCCAPDSHIYDNACDTTCNTCGHIRAVPDHVYTDTCDTICNICGDIRSITHTYDNDCDTICNVCAEVRTVPDHVYTHSCDKICNSCGHTRQTTHTYDGADDLICNVCKESLAPPAPVLLTSEPDTVTLQPQTELEYSMDGEYWQKSNVFTGLTHLTAYTFYQRVARSETAQVGPASPGLTVTTVEKYDAGICSDFTVAVITDTSVTLNQVPGCEYSLDGRNWQASPVFTGLTPGTEYTFYQRALENSRYYQSEIAILHVTTYTALGAVTYDANGGKDAPESTVGEISAQKPTREGYHFLGWALTPDTYAVYNPADPYNHQEDVVLYASWRKLCDNCDGIEEYFVACYSCAGTGHGSSETCFYCLGKGEIYEEETCPVGNCYGGSLILNGAYFGECPSCGGDGVWNKPVDCSNCNATGVLHYSCSKCHGRKGSWYPCTLCVSGVQKFTPEAPQKPALQSVSDKTVVLVSYPNCEYRVSGGSWQDSNVFSDLEEDREYTFYQRYKATTCTYASSASPALRVTTRASVYNKQYTVVFQNWDGSVISSETYRYEDTVWIPADPIRPADEDTTYTFIGWDQEITQCLGNVTYTAVFQADYIVGDFDDDRKVTDADAIYLLWHVLFPDMNPVKQSADMNGDGETSDADAIYLLWHTLFPDSYPLKPKN